MVKKNLAGGTRFDILENMTIDLEKILVDPKTFQNSSPNINQNTPVDDLASKGVNLGENSQHANPFNIGMTTPKSSVEEKKSSQKNW